MEHQFLECFILRIVLYSIHEIDLSDIIFIIEILVFPLVLLNICIFISSKKPLVLEIAHYYYTEEYFHFSQGC